MNIRDRLWYHGTHDLKADLDHEWRDNVFARHMSSDYLRALMYASSSWHPDKGADEVGVLVYKIHTDNVLVVDYKGRNFNDAPRDVLDMYCDAHNVDNSEGDLDIITDDLKHVGEAHNLDAILIKNVIDGLDAEYNLRVVDKLPITDTLLVLNKQCLEVVREIPYDPDTSEDEQMIENVIEQCSKMKK